jgi:nicotinamide mononucleotide transporter pnuC
MIFPLELKKNKKGEDRLMFRLKTRELWNYFTTYEKWWFFSILFLAIVFAILFPEEDINGVNGWIIATLYLLNIFLNILCELLISKQSKWNFIVSLGVELTEILIPLLLLFRFATLSVTLLFWIPIDIISFINWHKHPDQKEEELTKVRKLSGWAEVGVILAIIVWTVVVGTLMSKINIRTELFGGNRDLETWVNYLDALVSAVGMANGIFILLRLREQWIAWILDSIIEAIINILSGQYILLILKAGYLTNSIYGYIKWTKYIKEHKGEKPDKSLL